MEFPLRNRLKGVITIRDIPNPIGPQCIDRRYWKYGHLWDATLVVGDAYPQQEPRLGLPVSYILACEVKGEEAYKQAEDLVRNLNHHLNHFNFIKGFDLDISKFQVKRE